jgi:hypothetical protein
VRECLNADSNYITIIRFIIYYFHSLQTLTQRTHKTVRQIQISYPARLLHYRSTDLVLITRQKTALVERELKSVERKTEVTDTENFPVFGTPRKGRF